MIKKLPDVSALVTTAVLNARISEVENKMPHFSGLVAITVFNTKSIFSKRNKRHKC